MNRQEFNGTCTAFGMNVGLGGEYKLSSHLAAGLKLSMTSGSTNSFNLNGTKVTFDERMNLSSIMISAYMSFRTK